MSEEYDVPVGYVCRKKKRNCLNCARRRKRARIKAVYRILTGVAGDRKIMALSERIVGQLEAIAKKEKENRKGAI